MCVRLDFIGRLGNNLFQYAVARIIAEKLGLELCCSRSSFKPATWVQLGPATRSNLEELTSYFPNIKLKIAGDNHTGSSEIHRVENGGFWRGHLFDLSAILRNNAPREILLRGYFQRFEIFSPYAADIREWYYCNYPGPDIGVVGSEDVLVSLRGGEDYSQLRWTLPVSFYTNILNGLSHVGKIYVCGTGIDRAMSEALRPFDPIYLAGSAIDQFQMYKQFRRIILSNSTFAWWASFLSEAEELYCPRSLTGCGVYCFTGWRDVDLHTKERRYNEVIVPE